MKLKLIVYRSVFVNIDIIKMILPKKGKKEDCLKFKKNRKQILRLNTLKKEVS